MDRASCAFGCCHVVLGDRLQLPDQLESKLGWVLVLALDTDTGVFEDTVLPPAAAGCR
jgi:hypothetical protein